jgi:hypothetical protein
LRIKRSEDRMNVIISSRIRWLAVATGGFTAVAGSLGFTWGFAIVPSFLIVGAVVQPRFPRAGRVLMCAGALALSFWALSCCVVILPESRFTNRPDAIALSLISVLLVAWCDVAIVIEEVKIRRTQTEQKTEIVSVSNQMRWLAGAAGCLTAAIFTFDYGLGLLSVFLIVGALVAGRFQRNGRDLIWFGAGVVSLSELPIGVGILWLSLRGGTDPRVTVSVAVSVLLIVWCDAALVTVAFKKRRARRTGETVRKCDQASGE